MMGVLKVGWKRVRDACRRGVGGGARGGAGGVFVMKWEPVHSPPDRSVLKEGGNDGWRVSCEGPMQKVPAMGCEDVWSATIVRWYGRRWGGGRELITPLLVFWFARVACPS